MMWYDPVNIQPLLKNSRTFPWDIVGLAIPKAGSLHLYLCAILSKYGTHSEKIFLSGLPTMTELKRFIEHDDHLLARAIVDYSERVYGYRKSERENVAEEVLTFLKRCEPFMKDVQERIDSAYGQGMIKIPDECKPVKKTEPVAKKKDDLHEW